MVEPLIAVTITPFTLQPSLIPHSNLAVIVVVIGIIIIHEFKDHLDILNKQLKLHSPMKTSKFRNQNITKIKSNLANLR